MVETPPAWKCEAPTAGFWFLMQAQVSGAWALASIEEFIESMSF
jgi:hypothetical protein